jgi:hypothetical protein
MSESTLAYGGDDKKHGRGVHTWPSGARYEGQ